MAATNGYLISFTTTLFYGRAVGRGVIFPIPDAGTIISPTANGKALGLALGTALAQATEDDADQEVVVVVRQEPVRQLADFDRGFAVGSSQGAEQDQPSDPPIVVVRQEAPRGAGDFERGFMLGSSGGSAEVTDLVPPALGTVSPDPDEAPGGAGAFSSTYATAAITPIVIPVVDASSSIVFVVLSALYVDRDGWETVYAGRPAIDGTAGYLAGYSASTLTGDGTAGVGFTFSVRKDSGWPGRTGLASDVFIDTKAVDEKGNVLA